MAKRKKVIPTRYIRIDRSAKTVALMDRKTGKLKGRVRVRGEGDTTRARRVIKNVDVDKDGKPDFFGGTILGRRKKIKGTTRNSKKVKAYVRQIS